MQETAIECTNLVKSIRVNGQEEVLLRIEALRIMRGEQVVLTGPSGSGKTTLLQLISGMDLPTSGEVTLFNHALHSLSEAERDSIRGQRIGIVFQDFLLFPHFSAIDNVLVQRMAAGIPAGIAQQRAKDLLTRMNLGHRMHTKAGLLSRGEQQRVAIARAMLHEPELLLADEPTGNLDAQMGAEIVEQMRELCNATGQTLLMVTHDQHLAAQFPRRESMSRLQEAKTNALTAEAAL
ncbi:hypothetical protein SY83_03115 [Paenibacillus swuensis]|uniref:ABC transporter domain-containing protein n=1 Tax=Paenibacillus swuensis TaxID=1178515 RepID=A0A172TF16_9BACL|nr:ABC transporter ATP-binding protein [Paenibacillus swuensis]ANE45477.1 hypothetical protein SY83_03115 [Paenibacillus swuensis]